MLENLGKKGFTTVEIVMIVVIIAVVSLVAVTILSPQKKIHAALDQAAKSNVSLVANAMEACLAYSENGKQNTLASCNSKEDLEAPVAATGSDTIRPWIKEIPSDVVITPSTDPVKSMLQICSAPGNGHRFLYNTNDGVVVHDASSGSCP